MHAPSYKLRWAPGVSRQGWRARCTHSRSYRCMCAHVRTHSSEGCVAGCHVGFPQAFLPVPHGSKLVPRFWALSCWIGSGWVKRSPSHPSGHCPGLAIPARAHTKSWKIQGTRGREVVSLRYSHPPPPPQCVRLSICPSIHPFPHMSQEAALHLTGSKQDALAWEATQSVLDAKCTDQHRDTA